MRLHARLYAGSDEPSKVSLQLLLLVCLELQILMPPVLCAVVA